MTFQELQDYIYGIIQEKSLKKFLPAWINNAILKVASDFELPALRLINPETVIVEDQSTWLWPMPNDYHKKLFRCNYRDTDGRLKEVTVHDRIQDIEKRDHTRIGERITSVASAIYEDETSVVPAPGQKAYLAIDPLPQTPPVNLFVYYYRLPRVLKNAKDVCGCIPLEYHERVIPPIVMVQNYQFLLDMVINPPISSLQYWESLVNEGLNGREGAWIGLRYYLQKLKGPPRRTGGRDPVGWSPWRYGR
jgi:hypothetical protein